MTNNVVIGLCVFMFVLGMLFSLCIYVLCEVIQEHKKKKEDDA